MPETVAVAAQQESSPVPTDVVRAFPEDAVIEHVMSLETGLGYRVSYEIGEAKFNVSLSRAPEPQNSTPGEEHFWDADIRINDQPFLSLLPSGTRVVLNVDPTKIANELVFFKGQLVSIGALKNIGDIAGLFHEGGHSIVWASMSPDLQTKNNRARAFLNQFATLELPSQYSLQRLQENYEISFEEARKTVAIDERAACDTAERIIVAHPELCLSPSIGEITADHENGLRSYDEIGVFPGTATGRTTEKMIPPQLRYAWNMVKRDQHDVEEWTDLNLHTQSQEGSFTVSYGDRTFQFIRIHGAILVKIAESDGAEIEVVYDTYRGTLMTVSRQETDTVSGGKKRRISFYDATFSPNSKYGREYLEYAAGCVHETTHAVVAALMRRHIETNQQALDEIAEMRELFAPIWKPEFDQYSVAVGRLQQAFPGKRNAEIDALINEYLSEIKNPSESLADMQNAVWSELANMFELWGYVNEGVNKFEGTRLRSNREYILYCCMLILDDYGEPIPQRFANGSSEVDQIRVEREIMRRAVKHIEAEKTIIDRQIRGTA